MTAALSPLATPADRSISPTSSTNTRPIARIVIGSAWVDRLARFALLRNVSGFSAVNRMTGRSARGWRGARPAHRT